MDNKIFQIKGKLRDRLKIAFAVITLQKASIFSSTGTIDSNLFDATGAKVFVVAEFKDGSVKSDQAIFSIGKKGSYNDDDYDIMAEVWSEIEIQKYAKEFLSLKFWEGESLSQAEVMLSNMIAESGDICGEVEFKEVSDKSLAINAISLMGKTDLDIYLFDKLENFGNDELRNLLGQCLNRRSFLFVKKKKT